MVFTRYGYKEPETHTSPTSSHSRLGKGSSGKSWDLLQVTQLVGDWEQKPASCPQSRELCRGGRSCPEAGPIGRAGGRASAATADTRAQTSVLPSRPSSGTAAI